MKKRLLLALYDRSGLGAYMPVDYEGHELEVEYHMEKFAELIVRECIDICMKNQFDGAENYNNGAVSSAEFIKENFGVEK